MNVRNNRGVAVIGLLVVASIITLLGAWFLVVARRVAEGPRQAERANQADCISHLHAVGLAVRMYYADHRTYPGPVEPAADSPELQTGGMTHLYVDKYITRTRGLICPDDDSAEAGAWAEGIPPDVTAIYSSYNVDDRNRPVYNYYGLDGEGIAIPSKEDIPPSPEGMPGPEDADYPALFNPNAPDETVVTHCVHHRLATGPDELDIVLHLGGDVTKEPSGSVKWMVWWRPE